MRPWIAAAALTATALLPRVAGAQSLTTETDITAGRSTDGTSAGAVQVRLFGASRSDWRVYFEGTWGTTSREGSDAFGAAYPYDGQIRPMETYLEKTIHPGGALVGLRTGRYRTPFGISGRSDQAYVGFVRAPLIRYGENYALSNTFMEGGADVLVGVPSLYGEASVGRPQDEGEQRRRPGIDIVARVQGYFHSLILGASTIRTNPSEPGDFVHGRMVFHGVDGRWMSGGVQVRGEWITGRPFDGVTTNGGYLDVLVHHLGMGPITVVARAERLDYLAGVFSTFPRRLTAGARIQFTSSVTAHVNFVHQPGGLTDQHSTALDVSVTYSRRVGWR